MKKKTILIAHEDDLLLRSCSTFFQTAGYQVEKARCVSELIRKVRNDSCHVLLLDDETEGVKACDLVPVLKKVNGIVQVIVISSEESLPTVIRLRSAGIFYQAMKPLDMEELRAAVECAFEKIEREYPSWGGLFRFFIPGAVLA